MTSTRGEPDSGQKDCGIDLVFLSLSLCLIRLAKHLLLCTMILRMWANSENASFTKLLLLRSPAKMRCLMCPGQSAIGRPGIVRLTVGAHLFCYCFHIPNLQISDFMSLLPDPLLWRKKLKACISHPNASAGPASSNIMDAIITKAAHLLRLS